MLSFVETTLCSIVARCRLRQKMFLFPLCVGGKSFLLFWDHFSRRIQCLWLHKRFVFLFFFLCVGEKGKFPFVWDHWCLWGVDFREDVFSFSLRPPCSLHKVFMTTERFFLFCWDHIEQCWLPKDNSLVNRWDPFALTFCGCFGLLKKKRCFFLLVRWGKGFPCRERCFFLVRWEGFPLK
jgi:hypothetical protein